MRDALAALEEKGEGRRNMSLHASRSRVRLGTPTQCATDHQLPALAAASFLATFSSSAFLSLRNRQCVRRASLGT